MRGKISVIRNCTKAAAGTYFLVVGISFAPLAQAQKPVATYELPIRDAIKPRYGLPFRWAVAPDQSLLIEMWQPHDQWSILRLTDLESSQPTVEKLSFHVTLPGRVADLPLRQDPWIDPTGTYLVIRSPGNNIGSNDPSKQRWQATLAVIDLRTFTLATTVTTIDGRAGGHLFFSQSGTLMLDTMARRGSPFLSAVTALSLPSLDPMARCEYTMNHAPNTEQEWPGNDEISELSSACPEVMEAAHLSSIQQLADRPAVDAKTRKLAEPDCEFLQRSRSKRLALYRCGKEHLSDPAGAFGITFWYALKVLSLPDGKTILSLPLHFYEGKTLGLFAIANGHDDLIVRRGLKLLTYRLPDAAAPESRGNIASRE